MKSLQLYDYQAILAILQDPTILGGSAYLVGGCVRDLLLGRSVKDFDLALNADPVSAGKRIAKKSGGSFVLLHEETVTVRVVIPQGDGWIWVDIVPLGQDLNENLNKRDFTINAMALPLDQEELSIDRLIDPTGGLSDLQNQIIRQTSPQVFIEDPLRLLRAFRQAAVLQFQIEHNTLQSIQANAFAIHQVSKERVRDEIFALLETPLASEMLAACDRIGLLMQIFPELTSLKNCTQSPNHHLDVWGHTLEAIHWMDTLPLEDLYPGKVDFLKTYLAETITYPRSRKSLIKFALLFHDITKPETRSDENGRIQFRGHEQSSAPVAARITRQMRLSRLEESIIQRIIAYHLQPGFMAHRPLSSREIYHYFKSVGDAAPEALILTYADRMAARGPRTTPSDFEMHRQLVSRLLTEYFEQEERPKLLTGQDIIRELHLEPGPHVGELLSMLDEAQAVGEVKTRQDATEFIHRIEATFKEQGINEIKSN